MEQESSYINFLRTFINEEVYLFDRVSANDTSKQPEAPEEENQTIAMEPVSEAYVSKLKWQGNQEAEIAFILDEKLPSDIGQRFKKMLTNIGLKGHQVKSAYFDDKSYEFEEEFNQVKGEKLIILSNLSFDAPMLKDYSPITYNHLDILKAPAFTEIVKDKNNVLTFWEALSKFLA